MSCYIVCNIKDSGTIVVEQWEAVQRDRIVKSWEDI